METPFNFGKNGPKHHAIRGDVAEIIEDIANSIHGWSEGSKKRLEDALDELSVYDYHQVCTSLMLLKVEIGLGGTCLTGCEKAFPKPKDVYAGGNIARIFGYI